MRQLAEALSFRDPDGYIFESDNRILRYVQPHAAGDVCNLLASPLALNWTSEGKLVQSRILQSPSGPELPPECENGLPDGALVVEHTAIPFRNYPYEWSPEMLRAAAGLTLDLALEAMRGGYVLKDATPYNVMFDGARPVFVDLLSFRGRDPKESIWQPYAQFVRTFVLPLVAYRHFGLRPDELLLTHRDGIEPERLMTLCPPYRLLFPPFLSSVTLPVLLSRPGQKQSAGGRISQARDEAEARFLLESLFARARRLLGRPGKPRKGTASVDYMDGGHPYDSRDWDNKERFVARALEQCRPRMVLDIGCNSGHFSRLAAQGGARVVAIDRDEAVIDNLWQIAGGTAGILPLVVDIGRPPGACGWQRPRVLGLPRSRSRPLRLRLHAGATPSFAGERARANGCYSAARRGVDHGLGGSGIRRPRGLQLPPHRPRAGCTPSGHHPRELRSGSRPLVSDRGYC